MGTGSETAEPVLEVEQLSYRYPDSAHLALDGVDFTLAGGRTMLVSGASGAGKSTLCYALAGFVPHFFEGALEGEVMLDGRSMRASTLGEWVQHVGLVLQNPFNQITGARATVFEEVAFGLENLGVPREEMGSRVTAVLEQLDILELADRSPYALSGGQMQRVAIASILVLEPRLLVLDEPTAQLDPAGSAEVFALLDRLAAGGAGVVLASHQLDEVAGFADDALVLEQGRVVGKGAPGILLTDPRLAEWGVEPPIYVTLGRALGIEPPPIRLDEVMARLPTRDPERALPPERLPWPVGPLERPESFPDFPRVAPTPVTITDLEFTYPGGVRALDGVSLELAPGRIHALVGENGAGKSTLSRTLNGLLPIAPGHVRVAGTDVAGEPTSRLAARVGYLFQNPDAQLFRPTVADEIAFGPRNLGLEGVALDAAVARALAAGGLEGLETLHPYDLHPAQRRWVALASVVAMGAPVLILDEPTSGMGFRGHQRMVALLEAMRDAGHTLLVISHDMQFVAELADHVFVLAGGRLLAEGSPAETLTDPTLAARAAIALPPIAALARALALDPPVVRARALVGRIQA